MPWQSQEKGPQNGPSTPKRKAGSSLSSPSSKRTPNRQQTLLSFVNGSPGRRRDTPTELINEEDAFLSDEALARRLAAEDTRQIEADEKLARELQDAWTAEMETETHPSSSGAEAAQPDSTEAKQDPISEQDPLIALDDSSQTISQLADMQAESNLPRATPSKPRIDTNALDEAIIRIDLAQEPEEFSLEIDTSHWPRNAQNVHVPYALFAHGFARLNGERSRILIVRILTNLLRIVRKYEPDQLVSALYLMSNEIAPSYEGIELGIGSSLLQKATMQVSGRSTAFLRRTWTKHGDPGDVAFEACRGMTQLVQHEPLTIGKVYSTLCAIARASGQRSVNQKQRLASGLLMASRGEERRFVVRTLSANLRIHAMRTTVLTALIRGYVLDDPSMSMFSFSDAESMAKRAYARHPNWQGIVSALRAGSLASLDLEVGIPVTPMLGSITRSLEAVHTTMRDAPFVSEFKYDGQRIQLHVDHDRVHIFSRHLETITDKYPDIVAMVRLLQENASSFILDAEVVAMSDSGLLPFQTLAGRARKDVALDTVQVRVCVFAFDLLYLNGCSMLGETLRRRRNAMRESLPESVSATAKHAGFAFAASSEDTSEEGLAAFFQDACSQHCEGVMVKSLDHLPDGPVATYEPDKRTEAWLKVKKDYLDDLGDSLDLVPIGAWHGMGRKTTFWSPILLAVYNRQTETYEAVCKCMSGFTDAFYQELNEEYGSAQETNKSFDHDGLYEVGGVRPAIFWPPREVWEIRGADITASPTYPAANGMAVLDRGLSIRFPRFIRRRHDRRPETAMSPMELAKLYFAQGADRK
ncbi:hypothetical protein MYAM1_001857 [Malassezia yamatoensis]|uniref:DNA ligase n=1 Tax=Malassezia yamatoensis TaxID=253288 RepID=A0AAJ6CGS5_9BASI|nr:hypothetical protein MYAM1_001857 [Malassezia yamatoensis]